MNERKSSLRSHFALWNASSGARSRIHCTEFAAGHLLDFAFPASAVVHQNNLTRLHLAFPWLLLAHRLGTASAAQSEQQHQGHRSDNLHHNLLPIWRTTVSKL